MDGDDEVTRLRRRVSELQARLVALEGAEKKRPQVENELRESRKLYRALIETAFAGIGITDVEENLTFANPALGDIMGYGVEELIGINLSRFVESEEYNRYQELTEQRLQGFRNAYETRVRRKDGSAINVLISGSLPPLHERSEDIPLLVHMFIRRMNAKRDKPLQGIGPDALALLLDYAWPGNVRELQNIIERVCLLATAFLIQAVDLPEYLREGKISAPMKSSLQKARNRFDRQYLRALLQECQGNVSRAAVVAGMHRSSFQRLLKKT